ncbi:MAG: GTP-binding protein [Anaerolineales bacterium]|nr:GTP-binding protein [Anaerolineales bacterium]
MTFPSLLDDHQAKIWEAEKRQIQQLISLLSDWETDAADLDHLRQALHQLDELFLLVVVGEFNSGKSALINALLGKDYLTEGVTPTTDRIYVVRYGETGPSEFAAEDVRVLRYPAEFLREINVVDTPGTNAVLRRHESIVRDFIPRSDLVIFVTSADRPFTESERVFLEHIQKWGKKITVVINKVDILDNQDAVDEVQEFVRDQAHTLLGLMPQIFSVSARRALRASLNGGEEDALSEAEGFMRFRNYLMESLTQQDRIRLKLLSPLGVARKIGNQYHELAAERLNILSDDVQVLEKVEQHLELYAEDTDAEFERHLLSIDNELLEMRLRGEEFLDDRMRLFKVREMLKGGVLRKAFEDEVVGDTPEKIAVDVQEIIDWLVERELRQWRLMADELSRRRETETLRAAAEEASSGFAYNRRQLLDNLGVRAERVISTYDREAEAVRLVTTVQESIAMVGLVEISAIGLGLVLKALLVGATADATGLLAAGVLGILGFAIIPFRRGRAKKELRQKVGDLRSQLRRVLRESFKRELDRSIGRLREALAPYRRFVLHERSHLEGIDSGLGEVLDWLSALESEIKEAD